jgi:hypothetical protein
MADSLVHTRRIDGLFPERNSVAHNRVLNTGQPDRGQVCPQHCSISAFFDIRDPDHTNRYCVPDAAGVQSGEAVQHRLQCERTCQACKRCLHCKQCGASQSSVSLIDSNISGSPFAKALDSELTLQISNDGTNEQSNVVTTPRPAAISIAPACIAVIALGRTSPAAATTRIPSV